VGQALESDTAKVNEILRIPEMRNIFPPSLRLLWTVRPYYNGLYELIAIKVNSRDGRAPLDGEVIVDARAEEEDRGWAISAVMTAEGAKHWAYLTADNIDKWIAIVLDDKVYFYAYVLSEITGGKISIPGSFTESEAKEMALVLKSGMLPVPVRLVEEDSGR
jgi:SecD/SecF fusion protein